MVLTISPISAEVGTKLVIAVVRIFWLRVVYFHVIVVLTSPILENLNTIVEILNHLL